MRLTHEIFSLEDQNYFDESWNHPSEKILNHLLTLRCFTQNSVSEACVLLQIAGHLIAFISKLLAATADNFLIILDLLEDIDYVPL